jgi:HEAT repeat protein
MCARIRFVLLLCLLASGGCGKTKSTDELIADMNSSDQGNRLKAVRLLPQKKGAAEKVVPVLIEALKDRKAVDVRWSAAVGLGHLGEKAKDAVPALQAALHDSDARVRDAARVALSHIDPEHAPKAVPAKTGKK